MYRYVFVIAGIIAVSGCAIPSPGALWGSEGNKDIEMFYFWADWCPNCRATTPYIEYLEKTYSINTEKVNLTGKNGDDAETVLVSEAFSLGTGGFITDDS